MPDIALVEFWFKNIVGNLLLLPAGPMLVAAIGFGLRRRRLGHFLMGFAATTLFVLSLPIVAAALAAHDERLYPPLDPSIALPPRAAIVVLGGGLQLGASDYGGETISAITLVRMRAAAHLALRTQLPVLATGGRLPLTARSEAAEIADAMDHDFHVPVRWTEDASLDTADNIRLSVPILRAAGIETAVAVSDVSHMRRVRQAFDAAGMRVVLAPTDYYANAPVSPFSFIPNTAALRRSNLTLHEWLGAVWMTLRP